MQTLTVAKHNKLECGHHAEANPCQLTLTQIPTLYLLNPKSIGFDRLLRSTTVPSYQVIPIRVFVLSC